MNLHNFLCGVVVENKRKITRSYIFSFVERKFIEVKIIALLSFISLSFMSASELRMISLFLMFITHTCVRHATGLNIIKNIQ
jgi:hypothetical protein